MSGSGWKVVVMTSADISAHKHQHLQDAYAALFVAAGAPPAAIMFGEKSMAGATFSYYFNPSAAQLAASLLAQYGAVDCPAPDPTQLAVHVANRGGGAAG